VNSLQHPVSRKCTSYWRSCFSRSL